MKMWILLHILAYFFNINVILGNLLETFEIFTNHLFCQRSGCAGCIVTPRRSLITITFGENSNYWRESLLEATRQNIAG